MKKGVIVGILSGLILAISMWMPAMTRESIEVSFMDVPELAGLAWGIVIMGLALALFAFMNKKGTDIVGIVIAVLALLFSVMFYSVATEEVDGEAVKVGMGIYMMIVGSAGAIVGYIMNLIGRKAS